MPEFIRTSDLSLLYSVSSAPTDGIYIEITREQFHTWSAIPQQYRTLVGDNIVEMDASAKATVDAAALIVQRDALAAQLDQTEDVLRAFMLVVMDELNARALRWNAILDAIDGANNLVSLQSAVGAIEDYPQRTAQQLRDAVRARLGS